MIRVGFIGCGRISDLHAAAYLHSKHATITAVADPDESNRTTQGNAWGVPESAQHADAADLLARDDVDMVEVLVPHHLHEQVAQQAAAAGKHISLQKPMAMGLDEADTLLVESPYDYRRAVVSLLAEDLPEPGMPSYDTSLQQTIADVVRAARGRTLVLFTSHAAVRATAAALRDLLAEDDINVFAQSVDGSPQRLLRLLNERPRSVLLGTAAFWEGIDVPGEALSQIVIARLPFPVPTDPVYEGRSNQFEDPFGEYALPQAVLRFRQGFGRLIRGSTDRGVFVVLDSRIVRRQYGETFLEGLPDCEVRTMKADALSGHVERWLP